MVEIVRVEEEPEEKGNENDQVHDDDDDAKKEEKDQTTTNGPPSPSKKELTPLQKEGLRQICNGCGLAARDQIPLKRCSMCKEVWYHDRKCQQEDFPTHKKICKRLVKERQKQQQQQQQQQQFLTIKQQQQQQQQQQKRVCCRVVDSQEEEEEEEDHETIGPSPPSGKSRKGRYLVANQKLPYGTVIGPKNATATPTTNSNTKNGNPNNHWDPVSVVLLENHRRHRCLVCFGLILEHHHHHEQQQQDDGTDDIPLYPTRLCSSACKRKSASFLPSEKQAISNLLRQSNSPPMILPTAILLYRLVLLIERDKTKQTKKLLSELQSVKQQQQQQQSLVLKESEEQQEKAHQQAVTHTTWAMIKAIGTLPLWNFDDLTALLCQVKLNGFSICTAESVALGIGIYTTSSTTTTRTPSPVGPNLINHNCRPNLLQTFDYGIVGCFPTLRLTVCSPKGINPNEELTISYIDNTMPKIYRQQRLQKDYGFHCCCGVCSVRRLGSDGDDQDDQDDSSPPKIPALQKLGKNDDDDDDDILQLIQSDDRQVLAKVYQELKKQHQQQQKKASSKSCCCWHLQECGERLLQIFLDDLGEATTTIMEEYGGAGGDDDTVVRQKQYALAAQAFQLTEELLQLTTTDSSTSTSTTDHDQQDATILRKTILRYKSVKLRLFLNVNPQQAMKELETNILPICNTFFPGHHELMKQIVQDCCL